VLETSASAIVFLVGRGRCLVANAVVGAGSDTCTATDTDGTMGDVETCSGPAGNSGGGLIPWGELFGVLATSLVAVVGLVGTRPKSGH
jgi:hypothetical protein